MTTSAGVPAISHRLEDETLVELLYDPGARTTAFAVCRPDAAATVEPHVDLPDGERLVPYSARNNLITSGCVLLPSEIGEFGDKRDLDERIRAFINRYVDLDPGFVAICSHYVLLSWVYDAFGDLGYLRFRGDYGTGKTRALLVVGSLCYKAFFASGASTVSPIFHIQDAFQGTLILDEADFRFSDATSELTKVLNNGTTRGLPVLRTMTNRHRELNPTAFRVFGPKLVAMRGSFSDPALESRFVTAETSRRAVRPEIPIHLPPTFQEEARQLRNSLVAWRFAYRDQVTTNPSHLPAGLSPRFRQTSLALASLMDDHNARRALGEALGADEQRLASERSESFDGLMLQALVDAFATSPAIGAPVKEVARRFNELAAAELGRTVTNRWVGAFLRRQLKVTSRKTGGVYVVPPTEWSVVDAQARRRGLQSSPTLFRGSEA